MRVGWIADHPGYIGGAELSQAEFRLAAPEGVEIVECPDGKVVSGLDRYVAHNVCRYSGHDMAQIDAPVTWYHHDLSPWISADVRDWLNPRAQHIFCSELQREKYGKEGLCIPPAIDLNRLRPNRQTKRHGTREGVCSIGQWRGTGKGPDRLAEWARANGPVDVYGPGDFCPQGPDIDYKGALAPGDVPQTLWRYATFVFLPTAIEPFSRSVVEAWAAGCEVVTNGLVGAREWLSRPEKITSAGEDFWEAVCSQ